jgi:pimeloyl-ACP methyl ester carboxylesterase
MRRTGLRHRVATVACCLALGVSGLLGATIISVAAAPGSLRVGAAALRECDAAPVTFCGTLRVPLDWSRPSGPRIDICYRWYPATDASEPVLGTVLPVEGGPGYPSIGSVAPDGYRAMYGPILRDHNMLAVDLRGTGCSTPLVCPKLQDYKGPTGTTAFDAVVADCAYALDHRWRAPDGHYVQASSLFTSAPSAADVAAVIRLLDVPVVDVYGDSYGSWFAQVFASRYPSLVDSLILDSTYQVLGLDPWYRSTIQTMPAAFDDACARSTACAANPGSSWSRVESLAARLRQDPVSGVVPGPFGHDEHVTMNVVGLVNLVSDAAEDPEIYRGLDASARALLDNDDPSPLLRLYAQRLTIDEAYFGLPTSEYSVELYMAVSCLDYPQLFSMQSPPAARPAELAARIARLPSSTFTPFTTGEWLAMDQNTENFTACLDWPVPREFTPPLAATPPLLPKTMPVLILGGEFDTWTPAVGVPAVERQIGGDSRFVELANSTHVVGEADLYGCATSIVREFVADSSDLQSLDTTCAPQVPSIRSVGVYSDTLGRVPPLTLSSATTPGKGVLALAAAGVLTAGDAEARYQAIGLRHDVGLHGGTVVASDNVLTLHGDILVPGVSISGEVTLAGTTVTARVSCVSAGLATTLVAMWPLYGGSATATIHGVAAGVDFTGTMSAP